MYLDRVEVIQAVVQAIILARVQEVVRAEVAAAVQVEGASQEGLVAEGVQVEEAAQEDLVAGAVQVVLAVPEDLDAPVLFAILFKGASQITTEICKNYVLNFSNKTQKSEQKNCSLWSYLHFM